ncbi:MAG: phytanoyl-CoA dioxygenase family protein [Actinomycetota bacterium]|nr:phytanoyl-CoA dioxygenase family protein [Actinomycetota bacterium]
MPLTDYQVAEFRREGYLVLPAVLTADELAGLRAECERRLTEMVATMDAVGAQTLGLSHRDRRYFLHAPYQDSPFLHRFLFDDAMVDIAASLLGPDVYLFLELFVVKPPEVGMPMAWHQDGGYVMGHPHDPYISLWVALDDMTVANGTLCVLPRSRQPQPGSVTHMKDRWTNDLVGYDGPDPGDALEVPAGSIVAMASTTFHRTGENHSAAARRAFLASYSPTPITGPDGTLWNFADPCRLDGRRVAPPAG